MSALVNEQQPVEVEPVPEAALSRTLHFADLEDHAELLVGDGVEVRLQQTQDG